MRWWLARARPAMTFSIVMLLLIVCAGAVQNPRDLYCGADDCYEVLGLTRNTDAADSKKAYRRLAMKWHPDKHSGSDESYEMFNKISKANEIISDEQLRAAYDYFLDHPDDHYTHLYQYYHAVYSPKTPIWVVVAGTLAFLSVLQYVNASWRYSRLMGAIRFQPSFKRRVNEVFEAEAASAKGKLSKLERELLKERVEERVFEDEVEIGGEGFAKPPISKLIGVRAALLPYSAVVGLHDNFRWFWRFSVKNEKYGDEERAYLTRNVLSISEGCWPGLDEARRQDLVSRELWIPEHLQQYAAQQQEDLQQRRAQSGAYKRAKRSQKNN